MSRYDQPPTAEEWAKAAAELVIAIPYVVIVGYRHGKNVLRQALGEKAQVQPKISKPAVVPEEVAPNVTDWVREYEARRGRKPKIAEVQETFGLSKTTAWRRIKSA